jgi:hypothetical protein
LKTSVRRPTLKAQRLAAGPHAGPRVDRHTLPEERRDNESRSWGEAPPGGRARSSETRVRVPTVSGQTALHAASMRNVIAFAREVRIRFRDSSVIFASVLEEDGPPRDESFVARPWGVNWSRTFFYENVSRVAPVRRMSWLAQKAICAKQLATLLPARLNDAVRAARGM